MGAGSLLVKSDAAFDFWLRIVTACSIYVLASISRCFRCRRPRVGVALTEWMQEVRLRMMPAVQLQAGPEAEFAYPPSPT